MMAEKMKRTLALVLAVLLCTGTISVPVVAEEGTVVTSEPVVVVAPASADKADEGEAKTEAQQSEDTSDVTDLSIIDVFENNGQQTIVMQAGGASQLVLTQVVTPDKLGEKVQQPTQTLTWTDGATGLTGSLTVDKSEDTDEAGNTVVEEEKKASAEGKTEAGDATVESSSSTITVTNPDGELVSQEKTESSSTEIKSDDKTSKEDKTAQNIIVIQNGTIILDKTVENSQTVEATKTQEGDKIITTTIQTSTEKGSESGLMKEEDSGDGEQTPVDVTLTPGGGTIVVVVPNPDKKPSAAEEGDRPADETDKNYDYTDYTNVADREVTVQAGELKEEGSKGDIVLTPVVPGNKVRPGVKYDTEAGDLKYDRVANENGENIWVPRYERDDSEMPDYLKESGLYEKDEATGKWSPVAEDGKGSFTEAEADALKPVEGNIQFVYTQRGEVAVSSIPDIFVYNPETGKTEKWAGITDYVLMDANGNIVYTYCLDNPTNATQGQSAFEIENLDDVDYIQGTEEEQEEAKRHIRAVALNGYWGTDKGMGSVSDIRADLIEFINSQSDFVLEYDSNKSKDTVSYDFAEDKNLLLAYANSINAGMALTATQYALWNYGRDSYELKGFSTNSKDEEAVMQLLTAYLTSDYLADKTEKEFDGETDIIDKDNFLTDDGLKITVGDKVEGANADKDNDLYNVDISFTMVVQPSVDGDDLIIYLMQIDENGDEQVIRKARIAGSSEHDSDAGFSTIENDNGTYTFKDVPLAENSKVSFDLKIQGVQNLAYGVYVYKSVHGYDADQTMISVAEGTNEVDASVGFDFEFDVDEDDVYEYEHEWSIEVVTSFVETETKKPEPPVTTAVTTASETKKPEPPVTTAPPTSETTGTPETTAVTTEPPVTTAPPAPEETTGTPDTTRPTPPPETTGPVEETTGPEEETTGPEEETTGPEPEETEPEETTGVPETTVPETTAPETTAPVTTAPETTAPVTTAPVTTAPVTTAPEPETISETTEETIEIPDDDTPLAPPTGDNSGMMIALSIMSVCALLTLTVFNKKRKA